MNVLRGLIFEGYLFQISSGKLTLYKQLYTGGPCFKNALVAPRVLRIDAPLIVNDRNGRGAAPDGFVIHSCRSDHMVLPLLMLIDNDDDVMKRG